MNIRKQENAIFDKYYKHNTSLIEDGVVSSSIYLESHPKLLFVMKEDFQELNGVRDLRTFLRDGGNPHIFNNIARWTKGIRVLPEKIVWDELNEMDAPKRKNALSSVCVMNLSKLREKNSEESPLFCQRLKLHIMGQHHCKEPSTRPILDSCRSVITSAH